MVLSPCHTLAILILFHMSLIQSCEYVNVSISQKVEKEGFHKEIHWLIESSKDNLRCKALLQLIVPSGMYVNPDEILDFNRFGKISALIDGVVDVEKPSHESKEHTVYVYLSNSLGKELVELPIHLRYQRAVIGGSYGKVILRKPSLLLNCVERDIDFCETLSKVEAPCDLIGRGSCIWHNVSYQPLFDDVEILVPIGNLDHYPVVCIVTLLLGCAGTIYILSVLSNARV